ncbi:diguanylate cyclase [Litoribacillus peritrichatus]|uniref:diguanylate cyclase n=1 Tax=Litoribacillus peritrichatus TaxID=718191 RepID=A0ABP7N4A7_9GAMM
MLDEITQFKFRLRLYLSVFGVAAASFFSALQYSRGETITATISFLGGIYFILVIYLMIHKRHYLWKGRGFLFFIPITILNIIYLQPSFGIYWAYVGVVSFFLVMELKEASLGALAFISAVFYLAYPHYPDYVLYRIYGTILLVGLFTFSFSYLIERLHERINQIATHDSLTNTLNRYTFNTSIEKALNEFNRYQTPATLLLLDLDHFKKINDIHGHQTGDYVLKKVSDLLLDRLRSSDQVFRYGGEEFAILLSQTKLDIAVQLTEELRTMVESHDFKIGKSVTFSGGLSEVQEGDWVTSWLKRCDQALYQAKEDGRNKIVKN